MKILIEVHKGMVSRVYFKEGYRWRGKVPVVFVVDLDGAAVGEATVAERIEAEPLDEASDITREAIEKGACV